MNVQFRITCVYYPLWLRLTVVATIAFCVFALFFARRARHPALLCLVPIPASLVFVFLGLISVVDAMARSGAGRAASAAGCAEAQGAVIAGAAAAMLVAAIAAFRHRDRTKPVALAMIGVGVLLAADVALSNWIVNDGFRGWLGAAAGIGAVAAALYTALLVVVACRRGPTEGRAALPIVVLMAAAVLAVGYTFARHLQHIAMGG